MSEKKTILIVDDQLISRHTFKVLLSSENYTLVFAKTGKEALEKASKLNPDLMLLDVKMKDMSGFEVCQQLRIDPYLAELPIIMVTALNDRESRLRGIKAGADDFISKPFDHVELCARVHTITQLNRYRHLVETKKKLSHLMHYDKLTGLPNRQLLINHIHQVLTLPNKTPQSLAVLALNLDSFQIINHSLGHEIGDKILCETAHRLTQTISSNNAMVARLGADEFALMFETKNLVTESTAIAQRLLETISLKMALNTYEIVITASLGISLYPNDSQDPALLLKNAQAAMSRAKAAGKNTYQFFTDDMNKAAIEHLNLANRLRSALAHGELCLYYQPQIELRRGEIIGMEALLRWCPPEKELILPGKFVPVAEEIGLIRDIGEWVLRTACEQNKTWQRAGLPPLRVSVNVSSQQFHSPQKLLEMVKTTLAESGLDPNYLELELTESILLEEEKDNKNNILTILHQLREMGVHIALDDFGTGYSSLSYLKRFPVNTLKIDRSFVQDLDQNSDDTVITNTILALAHNLRLSVVAEGVETSEQFLFLQERQCEIIQGYFFSPPLSVEEMTHKLQQLAKEKSHNIFNSKDSG